ncbi:MAG TPA: Uma2 family endonuclease [Bryobacteraceae bacterium]|jgi:Uma2 family endonuclease|nr:Uma2 family endonuclease [Bryobacteraceae bacterium]
MGSRTLVPVDEYIATNYDPDYDYVDGELVDRNVGEKDHSKVQVRLIALLFNQRTALGIHVFPEQRVRLRLTRFRVPDVCVVVGDEPEEQVFTAPPFLCIEILSPEDRASRVHEKLADYLAFGVPYVWVIDPRQRRAYIYTKSCMHEAKEVLETADPIIRVSLPDILG